MTGTGIWRIAVATSQGERVDWHFGEAADFRIYDIDSVGPRLIGRRPIEVDEAREDRRGAIVRILHDCRMLLVAKVGATPRQLLADAGIDATDRFAGAPLDQALAGAFTALAADDR